MNWKIGIILLIGCCFTMTLKAEKVNCPELGIPVLSTQAKVDSFLAIYPNCEYVLSSYYAIDNVQIFWIKNDPTKYLLFLIVVLILILSLLKLLFKRVSLDNQQKD